MRALVTGGGGFLARYIVEKLLARGDSVRSFSRSDYPQLRELGVECVCGDLQDAAAVSGACEGIDVVFHVAALAGLWGKRRLFWGINVDGTRNVIRGCREHGVGRLVYTSSPSVVFGMESLEGVGGDYPYPKRYYSYYPESKALGEQAVIAANMQGLATCSLRPHLIWGPRDTHIVPMLLDRARSGRLIQIGDGSNRVDVTYVENAADAHLLAADALNETGVPAGKCYFIADQEPVHLWDWVRELLVRFGAPPVSRSISAGKAHTIGALLEGIHTVLPFLGEPRLTRFLASQFATSHYFDISEAHRDFGYKPQVHNDEGLRRTVAWFQGGSARP